MTGHDDTIDDAMEAPRHARPRLLLDELTGQIEKLRLLPGGSDADAERILAGITVRSRREREATTSGPVPALPDEGVAEALAVPATCVRRSIP